MTVPTSSDSQNKAPAKLPDELFGSCGKNSSVNKKQIKENFRYSNQGFIKFTSQNFLRSD